MNMPVNTPTPAAAPLAAGNFSEWLRAMRAALAGGPGMQVACGECVGCCTSSYFIKLRSHESEALQRIPPEYLQPAPDDPGTKLMGHDAAGHCPMFGSSGCSIYRHRPETCRTYDCRIFTAAGMQAGAGRTMINERIGRWCFDFASEAERQEQRAVQAAANFLRQHPVRFPGGRIPSRPAEVAVLAVKSYSVFLDRSPDDQAAAAGIVEACRAFDQQSG
jgi:Fe-S-cluster containining protein